MKVTTYTKYLANLGVKFNLIIADFDGFTEKQINKLQEAGCHYKGEWFILIESAEQLKSVCRKLRGFNMGYITMAQ